MRQKILIIFLIIIPLIAQGDEQTQGLITIEPFWRQALGGAVLSLPSVQAQSAVVALDGGNIRAYSTTGTPMWNYSARGRISPYVTRSREGSSYFSRTNGTLIALNRSGRELWRRSLNSPLAAGVVTGWDGRLFVPTEKKITCFTASGTLLWEAAFEEKFAIAPKMDRNGGIIFALADNTVFRLSQFGEIKRWTLSEKISALLSIDKQRIIVIYSDGTILELDSAGEWYIPAQSDSREFGLPKLKSAPAAAASLGSSIAAVFDDGEVSLLSLDEKKNLWSGGSHISEIIKNGRKPDAQAEIIFDENGIYILSKDGATGFSHNGQRLWYIILANTAAIPAFGNDGVLYSGGRDWILYAYNIEDREGSGKGSIYGSAPEGTYGLGRVRAEYTQDFPINEQELVFRLERITAGIDAGKTGQNEPAWTSFLMMIATSRFEIRHRLTSLFYLGKIGSQETIPWLTDFFRRETEPTLRSAAINAIGVIGVDPDGIAIQSFLFLLTNGGGIKDEQVLTAIASATGALCRFSGPPLSESGIRILNLLTANNQPPVVRRRAQQELASLRSD